MTSTSTDSTCARRRPRPTARGPVLAGLLLTVVLFSAAPLATVSSPLGLTPAQAQPAPPAYRVITHPSNPDSNVDRKFLAHAFLKKASSWSDGEAIRPVDQLTGSPVRRRFSEDVLERPVPAVRSYWQQMIFSGRGVPPPELDNDEAVVRYVARHAGAVGYVSGTADVRATKVLFVR